MGEVIRLLRGHASCGLCGGNGRIAFGDRPAAMVACPRCCGAVRIVETADVPFHAPVRLVPLIAGHALYVAGYFAFGVGLFLFYATARFLMG